MKKRYIPLSILILLLTCCSNTNDNSDKLSDIISENTTSDFVAPSESITSTSEIIESNTTEEPTLFFTITYDANGGQGVMDTQTESSETFTLLKNEYYKPGFNFLGWSLQPNGIVDYVDCEEVFGRIK